MKVYNKIAKVIGLTFLRLLTAFFLTAATVGALYAVAFLFSAVKGSVLGIILMICVTLFAVMPFFKIVCESILEAHKDEVNQLKGE